MWTFYSTRSTEILSWKKFIERVEPSKIQKWESLDLLEFWWLSFEQVPSTCRVLNRVACPYLKPASHPIWLMQSHLLEVNVYSLILTFQYQESSKPGPTICFLVYQWLFIRQIGWEASIQKCRLKIRLLKICYFRGPEGISDLGTCTYVVRCFGGIFDLPSLIRYFIT